MVIKEQNYFNFFCFGYEVERIYSNVIHLLCATNCMETNLRGRMKDNSIILHASSTKEVHKVSP